MNEFSAHQRGALAVFWFLTEGAKRVEELRPRLYDTDTNSTYYLLTNIGGVLPIVNRDGWWHLDYLSALLDIAEIENGIDERLDETPDGVLFCRPFKRSDLVRLKRALRHVRRISTPP